MSGGHDQVNHDPVNHPAHYTSHPSGIECIEVVEHMGFNLGNAIKYVWRADLKGDSLEDLRKAAWYVQREIDRRELAKLRQDVLSPPPAPPTICGDRDAATGMLCTRVTDHNGHHHAQAEPNALPIARWSR